MAGKDKRYNRGNSDRHQLSVKSERKKSGAGKAGYSNVSGGKRTSRKKTGGHAVGQSRREGASVRKKRQWIIPAVVVVLATLTFLVMMRLDPPLPPVQINLEQPIMGPATATVKQAEKWAEKRGATDHFVELAELYWELAPRYGVNPVVAYAQAGLETRYGQFGGIIDETYHNPCGLKTAEGGDDSDPRAHQRFDSWQDGVTAQLEHLCLYAGVAGYPLENPTDPRHFPQLAGRAGTIGELGKSWASSEHYAELLAELIDRMEVQYVRGESTLPRPEKMD